MDALRNCLIKICSVLFFCFIGFGGVAQKVSLSYYDNQISHYLMLHQYDSAFALIDDASSYFENHSDTAMYIEYNFVRRSRAYVDKDDYALAEMEMEKMKKFMKSHAQFTNDNQYKYFYTSGIIHSKIGNYRKSEDNLLKAQKFCVLQYGKSSVEFAYLLLDLAITYRQVGKFQDGLKVLETAESIFLSTNNKINATICLVTKADLLTMTGVYSLAIENYTTAIKEMEEWLGEKSLNYTTVIMNNLGVASIYSEKYNDAIGYFEQIIERMKKQSETTSIKYARALFNSAYCYEKLNKFDMATNYLLDCQEILTRKDITDRVLLAWSYNVSAKIALSKNDPFIALTYVQDALAQNVEGYLASDVFKNPSSDNCLDQARLIESFISKAQILQYINTNNKFTPLINTCFNDAEKCIQKTKEYYTSEKDKIELMKNSYILSDNVISFNYKEYKNQALPAYSEKAYIFSEKAKASVLLESLRKSKANSFLTIPSSIINHTDSLTQLLSNKTAKIASENTKEKLKLRQEIIELEKYFSKYKLFIKEKYPDFYDLKYADNIVSIPSLQQKMKPSTAVISYFVGDSSYAIFVITKTKFEFYQYPIGDLIKIAKSYRNGILYQKDEFYFKNALKLYTKLFPFKLTDEINELVIIPHDFLTSLPFEALLTQESTVYTNAPYLIAKYKISYSYSVSLYNRMQDKKHVLAKQHFLGIAPVFKNANAPSKDLKRALKGIVNEEEDMLSNELTRTIRNDQITPIPATEIEINEINNLFKKQKLVSSVVLNEKATKKHFTSADLSMCKYLHVATHGFVDNAQPDNSGIILFNDKDTSDNVVYAKEIYNLKLNADLVTLSACETGLGKIKKGEGIIGLTRPLLFAGAKNIMVSLWKVSDNSTSALMIDFYKEILKKEEINTSLGISKRNMIKTSEYSKPFYWASFVLIGK